MPEIQRYGDRAVIVDFGDRVSPGINEHVLSVAGSLDWGKMGIRTVIPTYNRLVIEFLDSVDTDLVQRLVDLDHEPVVAERRLWTLPVCYELGLDHDRIQEHVGLDRADLIDYHSSLELYMYGYGFLPGMPKLGDTSISAPRRLSTPRTLVAAGSIGWVENYCNIYPRDSSAGWNIIGRTPVTFFDLSQDPPNLIAPGDRVRFRPITLDQFESGDYEIASVEI